MGILCGQAWDAFQNKSKVLGALRSARTVINALPMHDCSASGKRVKTERENQQRASSSGRTVRNAGKLCVHTFGLLHACKFGRHLFPRTSSESTTGSSEVTNAHSPTALATSSNFSFVQNVWPTQWDAKTVAGS
eukprot:6515964-Prymnesium_polylepis.1